LKTIKYAAFTIIILLSYSCSDSSAGPGEIDTNPNEGIINVTGDLQAQHEGISQYVGLRSDDGKFINLTLHVTEFPIGSEEVNDFSFDIRMLGSEGPFPLETGEYEIGESDDLIVLASYSNRTLSEDTVSYSTSPISSGTVTILSINSTNIEAVFDVTLHVINDEGSVNITGELNAECLTADAGFGC